LVGDWLQVDSDNYGDVIVQTKKDSDVAYVTVLRGHARVYQGVDDKESGGGMSGRAVSVAAGVQVEVKKGDTEPIKLVQPKASSIGKVVLWTSPYLKPNEKMGDDRTETPLIGKKAPKKYKAALALAEQALAANDPLLAIEALKPFEKKMKYRGNIALGRAYMGAFLYKQAFGFLKKARKQNDDLTEAHFLTGYLYLSEGRWSKAIQYLEDVDPIDKEQEQLVEYYLGVANYYLGSKISARNHFEYSRWAKVNEGVEASAQEFLKDVDSGGWLDLRFFAGAAFDSNILRASDDTQEALPLEIDGISGSGYVGGAGFTLNAFKGDAGHVLFGYDFKQTGYVNPTYAPLTLSEQSAFFDFILGFGGEEFDEHYFAFGARLEAAAIQLGENRAMDQMKADVTLASPVAYGLGLKIVNMQNLDPLPGEEDSLDPILWEMVATGDRSNRVGLYGLELSPIKSSSVNLETEILFGESKMRHDLQQSYNHKISIVNLDLRWMLSLRTHFDFDLGYLTRDFSESDDSRKDSQTKFGVGWRWYFTTSLSQLLAAGMENQSSSRDSNTYSRTTTQYSLHLDF
jgi:tetratricopeptide (TPR) repeat protein